MWGSAAGALIAWEPFDFGLRGKGVAAAAASRNQAQTTLKRTQFDVAVATAEAYTTLAAVWETVQAARAGVVRAEVIARTVIQIALTPEAPKGEALRERLRAALRRELPACRFSIEAGDIVSQIMGFGSPTPIEIAVQGINLQDDYAYARKIHAELAKVTNLRDLQFAQEVNYPTLDIEINRDRAGQFGLTMADVVRSVVPATSSSRFIQPNYWRDPNSGNAFQIQVQLPQNRVQSVAGSASFR